MPMRSGFPASARTDCTATREGLAEAGTRGRVVWGQRRPTKAVRLEGAKAWLTIFRSAAVFDKGNMNRY